MQWSDWSGGVGIIRESKKTCPVVSDSSGGVGMVCGMECGISERTVQLGIELAHVRSRSETLKRSATSCAFANLECEPPRVCSPKFPTRFRFKSCPELLESDAFPDLRVSNYVLISCRRSDAIAIVVGVDSAPD
jgi:hypothetical protein